MTTLREDKSWTMHAGSGRGQLCVQILILEFNARSIECNFVCIWFLFVVHCFSHVNISLQADVLWTCSYELHSRKQLQIALDLVEATDDACGPLISILAFQFWRVWVLVKLQARETFQLYVSWWRANSFLALSNFSAFSWIFAIKALRGTATAVGRRGA